MNTSCLIVQSSNYNLERKIMETWKLTNHINYSSKSKRVYHNHKALKGGFHRPKVAIFLCVCSYKRLWLLLTSGSSILFGFLQLHADIKIWWPCFYCLKNNHSKSNVMHQCCIHMFVVLLMSLYLEFWADTTLRPCV